MKTKYFSQIDNGGILWYRKLNPDGSGWLRRAGKSYSVINGPDNFFTEEAVLDLGYLPCTKREATERGKFQM